MHQTVLFSVSAVLSKAGPIVVAILFFGLLIMSHEAGHFAFAKLFGVKVNEFAFGMGPTLFSRKKGETKYAVHLFPIGGFVSMEGENEDCEDERAFGNKPAWQRFIIIAAGATVNLIMGFFIVVIMLAVTTEEGSGIGTAEIYKFDENAVSCSTLQEGDIIKKINGKNVFTMLDVSYLMGRDEDGKMQMTVKRNGVKVDLPEVVFETVKTEDGNTTIFDFILVGVKPTPINVIKQSALETLSLGRIVWLSFFDLVTGQYGLSDLSGPIGTVAYVAEAAEDAATTDWGLSYVLLLMSLIAINIGLFNLFPIPALDGGRLFFLLIEMIFRKPVPKKYEAYVHAAGMVFLLGFVAVVSMSDIFKLIRGEF